MALVLGTNSGFVTVAPTADPADANLTIDGSSVVTKDTSPAGATTITEIGFWREGTDTSNFEVGLYAADGTDGVAGTRLFVDDTNSSSTDGWITVSVSWAISASTAYWLAVQMDAHAGNSITNRAASGGAGHDTQTSQTTLNDPYGGGAAAGTESMLAIYALVTISGGTVVQDLIGGGIIPFAR